MSTATAVRVDLRTTQQQNLDLLKSNFGLSADELNRCIFFRKEDDEPWIPSDILEAIARKTGKFSQNFAVFDQYVEPLKQIIHIGTVTDEFGRTYMRSGVATIGEKPNGVEIETTTLSRGRAMSAALTAAGFNPFKASTVVDLPGQPSSPGTTPSHTGGPLNDREKELHQIEDEAVLRKKDLRQIHKLATDKGLIDRTLNGDEIKTRYRAWLKQNFGAWSATELDASRRAQVIKALSDYDADAEYIQHLPAELREEALIA